MTECSNPALAHGDLPADALVLASVTVVSYIEADGSRKWMSAHRGDATPTELAGLLARVQHDLLCERS